MRFLALFFLLPSLSFGQEWTKEDTYRQSALTALLIADCAQTRWIVKHPQDAVQPDGTYHWRAESNGLLGAHPSIGKVNNYFAASIIGHAVIGHMLPLGWRQAWQYVWIGIEAETIRKNHIGIKYGF